MFRFCANLSTLYPGLPLAERIAAASADGFRGVELFFPYDENAAEIGRALARHRLSLAVINCPPPNYADPDGPRGFAAVPGEASRFRTAFRRAKRYAEALGAERIHVMSGRAEGGDAAAVFADNLAWAAAEAPELELTIEPMNDTDMPGYFLDDFSVAMATIESVGAENLRLQFDAYHAHRITGDLAGTWLAVRHLVGHVQVADHPGRHEPGSGEIDYADFFGLLSESGYHGWVGCEYHPREGADAGPDWRSTLVPGGPGA